MEKGVNDAADPFECLLWEVLQRELPRSVVKNTKRITSFDNVIFIVGYEQDGAKGKKVVVRCPRKDPVTRPRQHTSERQAWAARQWRELGM
jgi:hypothetical protein